jgi:hypothetical protein
MIPKGSATLMKGFEGVKQNIEQTINFSKAPTQCFKMKLIGARSRLASL